MKNKRILKALTAITAIFLLSMVFAILPSAAEVSTCSPTATSEGIRVPVRVSFTVADPPADAAGKSFNFEVTTLDGAPQPDTAFFALTDGGEKEVHFQFDRPGIYKYRVSQLPGTDEYWSYDGTVWLVDVYVFTDDAGTLTPTVIIRQESGNKAAVCSFQNRYVKPDEPPSPDTGDKSGALPAALGVAVAAAVALLLILPIRRRRRQDT